MDRSGTLVGLVQLELVGLRGTLVGLVQLELVGLGDTLVGLVRLELVRLGIYRMESCIQVSRNRVPEMKQCT